MWIAITRERDDYTYPKPMGALVRFWAEAEPGEAEGSYEWKADENGEVQILNFDHWPNSATKSCKLSKKAIETLYSASLQLTERGPFEGARTADEAKQARKARAA